jgi:hypothetical protein
MGELVANCPRCGAARTTLDVLSEVILSNIANTELTMVEAFCRCRHCGKSTVYLLSVPKIAGIFLPISPLSQNKGSINSIVKIVKYITLADNFNKSAPEYTPDHIGSVFIEASRCLSIGCFNAAATMFRLCIDLATKAILPNENNNGLNNKIRRNLGLRLHWLFDQGLLAESLRDLSSSIQEDGNDGAHDGNLKKHEAEDLQDFTEAVLERLYTEPMRVEVAKARRSARRSAIKS